MEHGLGERMMNKIPGRFNPVLILVLMEHGLGAPAQIAEQKDSLRLNPCSNGTWSRSIKAKIDGMWFPVCLNPCSNGTWSRRKNSNNMDKIIGVLILVLMEHGLGEQP